MKAPERTKNILKYMKNDILEALEFSDRAGSFEVFCADSLYRKGIVMSIINIGELAKKLPVDFKEQYKEIPWRKIAGMRDLAAHGYHTMDEEIIWDVVKTSLPELLQFTRKMLD